MINVRCEDCGKGKITHELEDRLVCVNCYSAHADKCHDMLKERKNVDVNEII